MASSALPLKVNPPATPKATPKAQEKERDVAPTPVNSKLSVGAVKDISSPHELTAFVETLLENLDAKFDEMSTQILDRMSQMSTRVDALEASIQDIINGDVSVPQSPSPGPGVRRSDSGI
ncbi:heat shock factor binding protein 1-domain-containing protein [Armillaria fumosa]|nr:heat shock factor binding protein 1-domain-containing protein [Armillaria fumosa]